MRTYFICDELDCGFYYSGTLHTPIGHVMSIPVVALDRKVQLVKVGMGEDGVRVMAEHDMADHIFPVNLFDRPPRIDVRVSRAVTPELHERWLRLVAYCKGEPFVSSRRWYALVRESDGGTLCRRLLSDEELSTMKCTAKLGYVWRAEP